VEASLVACWIKLQPLRGRVDTGERIDRVRLLGSVVHEDFDVPQADEVNVDVVPWFGTGAVAGRSLAILK